MMQNTIAVIWDFDKTLIDDYMQTPIFNKYNVDEKEFWNEVNEIPAKFKKEGIRVNRDTFYLNHFLTYEQEGKFKGLNNSELRNFGNELVFCDGLIDLFKELKSMVSTNPKYQKYDIKVEHYIVSTGLTEMIKGSEINTLVDGIWGCEFLEKEVDGEKVIDKIAYAIDNTSKTRAIFEINKGTNKYEKIDANSKMAKEQRRIPIYNMIYIADGPSDVPVYAVVKDGGGYTFAVYRKGNEKEFDQVDRLRAEGRVDMFGETDYKKDTLTYMWITRKVMDIADSIFDKYEKEATGNIEAGPTHITD